MIEFPELYMYFTYHDNSSKIHFTVLNDAQFSTDIYDGLFYAWKKLTRIHNIKKVYYEWGIC